MMMVMVIAVVYVLLGLIVLIATVTLGFWLYSLRIYKYWKKHGVPHAKTRFPLGSIGKICFKQCPGENIGELYQRGKGHPFVGIWLWLTPALIIRDLELMKNILVRDFTSFHDRVPHVNIRRDPLSGHSFSLKGSRWRNVRPKLTPAFTSGKLKNYFGKFIEYSDQLVNCVHKEIEIGYGVVDMREIAARFTTDISISYALGTEARCLKDKNAMFRKMGRKFFAPTTFNCLRSLVPLLIHRAAKLVRLDPTDPKIAEFFLGVSRKMISHRENSESQSDFLQCIVDMKKKGKLEVTDKDKGEYGKTVNWTFSTDEAAAQAFIFFVAGFETSSIIIQYALYEMALNTQIQDSLREEVKNTLARFEGKLTYDGLQEMNYLDKVVQETLRKYPVVPLVFRTCTKPYKLPNSNFTVPVGMQVLISVFGLHHNPEYYPDPQKFDPERFSEEEKSQRNSFTYLPFGDGPRNCLGMRFSLLQKKIGIVSLISNFRFEICDQSPVPHKYNRNAFFLAPYGGMRLLVTKLKEPLN